VHEITGGVVKPCAMMTACNDVSRARPSRVVLLGLCGTCRAR